MSIDVSLLASDFFLKSFLSLAITKGGVKDKILKFDVQEKSTNEIEYFHAFEG